MASLRDHATTIISELTRLQTLSSPFSDESNPFPSMIEVGDGRAIVVSQKIDDAILEIANTWHAHAKDVSLASKTSLAEWRQLVRAKFGPALATIDLNDPVDENGKSILAEVRSATIELIEQQGSREHAFGCTLFGDSSIKPFEIGPVRIEPRLDWLARKSSEGAVSKTARRRIERAWEGKTLTNRKPSADSLVEQYLLDTVGTCPFVCSVQTDGLAPEASREKALTAARLALAAIALLWPIPSRALDGMNLVFDRRLYVKKSVVFVGGKAVQMRSSISHLPHGPTLKDGEWETLRTDNKDYFDIAGEILNYVLDPTRGSSRPIMLNTLTQALLWFHEGCRETTTLMAIVKFSATLDALARGGASSGIKRLIAARLGLQENTPIRPGGQTMKAVVEKIYNYGRSRTIHGTNDKLGHDWSDTRSLAEQFAHACLLACFDWAAKNPESNDPKQLSS